jgi:predicted metal-dependent hydrolase
MSRKSPKIEALIARHRGAARDPHYLAYFDCFNGQDYYDAHDVLEALWLRDGKAAPDYAFYKGLIQVAGGFVHLKLQHGQPGHHVHGRRLDPALRLFRLALANLASYPDLHAGLDLRTVRNLCGEMIHALESAPGANPWEPGRAPVLNAS